MAAKKAQEAEEINQILSKAGIDPAKCPDSATRKNVADVLSELCDAEGERRRRLEQEDAFRREAGLIDGFSVHLAASSLWLAVATSSDGPPRTPVLLSDTQPLIDGSLSKDTFSGSSSSSHNVSTAAGSSSHNGKISVKDIKKLLQDEERMDGFRKFKEGAERRRKRHHHHRVLIVLIPEILFFNTDATNLVVTRRLQDGVQQMRFC